MHTVTCLIVLNIVNFSWFYNMYCRIVHSPPPTASSQTYSRVDWLVGLEELFNFRAPAFPEVRSALAANRDLIDGPSPVSVLSLPLLRPGVCCKIGL